MGGFESLFCFVLFLLLLLYFVLFYLFVCLLLQLDNGGGKKSVYKMNLSLACLVNFILKKIL